MLHLQTRHMQVPSGRLHRGMQVAAGKGFGARPKAPKSKAQTCQCGSKSVYRECCQPFHLKKAVPATAEEALRARFTGIVKGELDYMMATDKRDKTLEDPAQMKRDVSYTINNYKYSGLKLLEQEAGDSDNVHTITFQYKSSKEPKERTRFAIKEKAEAVDRNLDGSVKVYTTVEKSRFEKGSDGVWMLVESEVLSHD